MGRVAKVFAFSFGVFLVGLSGIAGAQTEAAEDDATASTTAAADPKREDAAKQAYKEAAKAAEAGKLEEALALYQKADQLVPAPAPKFKVALTLDKLERFAEAQAAYEAFLEIKPDPDKFFSKVESARDRLRAFLAMPATIEVTTKPSAPPNLVLAVDRMPQPSSTVIVLPGTHTLTAVADGFTGSKTLVVRAAERMAIEIELVPEQPKPAVLPPPIVRPATPVYRPVSAPPRHEARTAAYVAFGLAGVQAIVGGIFVIQALSDRDEYDRTPTLENKYAIDRSSAFADAFVAAALTTAVGGVVLLLIDPADPPASNHSAGASSKR